MVLLAGCVPSPAARVQGRAIQATAVEGALREIEALLPGGFKGPGAVGSRAELRKQVLLNLIYVAAILEAGKEQGISPDPARVAMKEEYEAARFPNREAYLRALASQGVAPGMLRAVLEARDVLEQAGRKLAGPVDESRVREHYQRSSAEYVRFTFIDNLFSEEGAARSFSMGQGASSPTRNEISATLAELSAAYASALRGLAPGSRSRPFRDSLGWHVLEVEARKELSLEEARPLVEEALYGPVWSEKESQWLKEVLSKAAIEVNPRYGEFSRESFSLVPAPAFARAPEPPGFREASGRS